MVWATLVDVFTFRAVDGRLLEESGAGDNGAERVSEVVRNNGEQLLPRGDGCLGFGARGPLLPIHPVQLELPRLELLEDTKERDVLLAYLLHRARRREPGELGTDAQDELRSDLGSLRRERLPELDRGSLAGNTVGAEGVHDSSGAQNPQPHPRPGLVVAGENVGQVGDALAAVGDADEEVLGRMALDGKLHAPTPRVEERIAHDFGDCGRDARLIVGVEFQERGNLPGPLAHEHDVRLRAYVRGEEQAVYGKPPFCSPVSCRRCRPTRTTTSSSRLAKSR